MIAETAILVSTQTDPSARASARPACAHCGLDVPAGLYEPAAARQFCCDGCRAAFEIIHGCGLERYYALRDGVPSRCRATGRRYAEFDDPVFQGLYSRPLPAGGRTAELFVEGVHCAACVWLVEKLPLVAPGVTEARLDMRRSLVRVTWDEGTTALSAVARALDTLGYPPHPARDARARERRRAEDRRYLVRLGVAGACAGNVMVLALALYAGAFDAIDSAYGTLFRWTSLALSALALAWPGSVFFRGAIGALRTRTPHMDVPIALGLGAGAVWSAWCTLRGVGDVYFDSLSVLVFALLAGRWVQQRQQRWTGDAVELLFSMTPTSARRVEGDALRDVPIEALRVGDEVEVRAGESLPADGIVVRGESSVDQALLTGESAPVQVGPGDAVAAGAVNLASGLRVRVEAAGAGTRIARLMALVEEGAARRAPIIQLADRLARWFLRAVILGAIATLIAWVWIDPARAVGNTAALLIVCCPCALGLSTPLALTVAIGRAGRAGALIKGGDAVERLAGRGTIYLDKTGTITDGRLAVQWWAGDESVRGLAAALERDSSHPIARALGAEDGANPTGTGVVQTTGGGVVGRVSGREVVVGSPAFVSGRAGAEPSWLEDELDRALANGLTPVLVAVDGRVAALAALGDSIRPDAPGAVARLRGLGWRVGILSGDHPRVVERVADRLRIEPAMARGALSPEEKLAVIRAAGREGPVVMVGDGVNDAAALAAAGVGIAVRGGAEASLAAADIYLNQPGLRPLADLVVGARRTMRVVNRNLGASLAYNLLAAGLAAGGVLTPLIAAVLMPVSSLTVLTSSLRSRSFGARP